MNDKIKYLIALSQLKGVGFRRSHDILKEFGSAHRFIEIALTDSKKIPPAIRDNCGRGDMEAALVFADEQMAYCERYGVRVLAYDDEEYPYRLRRFEDSPLLLYAKGEMDLNALRTVGIVGTRKMTPYGKWMVEDLIRDLEPYRVTTVSGLAYGVDTQVHKSSVDHHVSTIGVMGTGIDQIYPGVNRSLAKKMILRGGILTEYGVKTKPETYHFPARNRIIAALSDAVVVVESKEKGGAMITADLAFGYDKDVFAFPGKATDPYSRGANLMIKCQKAQLIENVHDLINAMSWDSEKVPRVFQPTLFQDLSPEEREILTEFEKNRAFHIDQVLARLPYSNSQTAAILLNLELKGILKTLPGSRYIIV